MKCYSCGFESANDFLYCGGCGAKVHENLKEQIKEEISKELKEGTSPPQSPEISTPENDPNKNNEDPLGEDSYETPDPRYEEYKNLFKQVLADRKITPDEFLELQQAVKRLELTKEEEVFLQKDVSQEVGIDYGKIDELCVSSVNLLVNANRSYISQEMDALHFMIENISADEVHDVMIETTFLSLQKKEKKFVGRLRVSESREIHIPFVHTYCGNEVVQIDAAFFDVKGNPYIYRGEIEVKVYDRERIRNLGNIPSSVSINIQAEKIMGNDFSGIAPAVAEKSGQDKEASLCKRSSFLSEDDSEWKMLFMFYDDEGTVKQRNEIIISKKLKEGDSKFCECSDLKTEAENLFPMDRGRAKDCYEKAYSYCKEAQKNFKRVREIDPENTYSYEKIRQTNLMVEDLDNCLKQFDIKIEESPVPQTKVTSGTLALEGDQKRWFFYSKEKIVMGRGKESEIVLRVVPYMPKEKYEKNWNRNMRISSRHAEIINRSGSFYLQDTKGNNRGSTNGTFINGERIESCKDYPLKHNMTFSVANVLTLDCEFLGDRKSLDQSVGGLSSCMTVMGDLSESCFGADKKGALNAIRIKRRNNFASGEEYIILIRELTIGTSRGNGIVLSGEKVHDRHARICFREDQYWIEDLNSRYGTWVNGEVAQPEVEIPLGTQATIAIGDVVLKFKGFS